MSPTDSHPGQPPVGSYNVEQAQGSERGLTGGQGRKMQEVFHRVELVGCPRAARAYTEV